jgi:magnesium transporter
MIVQLLKPEFEELIKSQEWLSIKEVIADMPAVDIAELLEEIDDDMALLVFRLIKKSKASDVFSYLQTDSQLALIQQFNSAQVREIMTNMSPDDRASFLEELPGGITQIIMNSMDPKDLNEVRQLLGYPEYSVGRIMTPKYVRIKSDWTVERALDHVRKWGRRAETINVIYVVDEKEKLIDDLTLSQLIMAPPLQEIASIIDNKFVALDAFEDQENAVKALSKYDRVALPVVDSDGILVGIITADDMFDIAEEETTEDMQLMAGMTALDDDYSQTGIGEMVKKRIGWLVVLLVGQILTATALNSYEELLSSAVFLAAFIPMIISSGGNSGSQAATLIIRALSTEDISLRDWFRVMKREFLSGMLLGLLVGVSGFLVVLGWAAANGKPIDGSLWLTCTTVGISLSGVILFGNMTGSMLPFILSKLGLDPAVTSAPFVSTLGDVTGILIYFSLAMLIFGSTLG